MANGISALRQAQNLRGSAQQISSMIPGAGFAAPGLAFAAGQNIGQAQRLEEDAKQQIIDYETRLEQERQKQVTQQDTMNQLKIIGATFDLAEQVYKRTANSEMAADFFNSEIKKAGIAMAPLRHIRFTQDGKNSAIEYYAKLDKDTGNIEVKRIALDAQGNFKAFKGVDEQGQPIFETAKDEDIKDFMPVKILKSLSEVKAKAKMVKETGAKERASNLQTRINRLNTEAISLKRERTALTENISGVERVKGGKQERVNEIDNRIGIINNQISELNNQLAQATGTQVETQTPTTAPSGGLSTLAPAQKKPIERKTLSKIFADTAANL
jgi:predicted SnoaL-like aldol condensation-catalyzing enzyme